MLKSAMPSMPCVPVPEVLPAMMPQFPVVPEFLPAPPPVLVLPERLPADLPAAGRAALASVLAGELPGRRPGRGELVRESGPWRWDDAQVSRLLGSCGRSLTCAGDGAAATRWSTCSRCRWLRAWPATASSGPSRNGRRVPRPGSW